MVAHEGVGLGIADIANPAAPVEVGAVPAIGLTHRVAFENGRIVVADGAAGLTLYEDCLVFEDGFESGNVAGWSFALP